MRLLYFASFIGNLFFRSWFLSFLNFFSDFFFRFLLFLSNNRLRDLFFGWGSLNFLLFLFNDRCWFRNLLLNFRFFGLDLRDLFDGRFGLFRPGFLNS